MLFGCLYMHYIRKCVQGIIHTENKIDCICISTKKIMLRKELIACEYTIELLFINIKIHIRGMRNWKIQIPLLKAK